MKLTQAMKTWLVEQKGLSADAADEDFRKAAADAMLDGSLTHDKYVELCADPDAQKADSLESKLDTILGAVNDQGKRLETLESRGAEPETKAPETKAPEETKKVEPQVKETAPKAPESAFDKAFGTGDPVSTDPNVPAVRVVGAHERYSKTPTAVHFPETSTRGVKHPFAGQRVFEGGDKGRRYIDEPSELDQAVSGAYIKWAIASEKGGDRGIPQSLRMTDHDNELMQYALRECKWGGVIGGQGSEDEGSMGLKGQKLTPFQQKALIDDATSGGIEAAPIMFDDQVILTPLLNGEFFPRVNVVNITRGRRIEGASIGNVTLSSGGADGSAIPLFNTASFISAFDTNIFVVNGSVEIGLDFLSDSPIDVSSIITAQYGQQLLTWLDTQVCTGDGTTEPEGITNASGTTSVSATNTTTGPPTVGDYEGLLFGIPKNFKQGFPTNRITFAGTETSYQRARGIAVGGSDQRRVFGMDHENYMLFGHPYGIGEFFTNSQIAFVNWGRYRMYRRLGLTIKVTTEGKELVRNNFMLITARARYGGQIETGSAVAITTNGQS